MRMYSFLKEPYQCNKTKTIYKVMIHEISGFGVYTYYYTDRNAAFSSYDSYHENLQHVGERNVKKQNFVGDITMIDQINSICSKEDFIDFLKKLSFDYHEHYKKWANTTISDYLQQMASWIKDYSECPVNDIAWEQVDFRTFAKILYMGNLSFICKKRCNQP